MERYNPKSFYTSITAVFRSVASGNMNPDLSWVIIVMVAALVGAVIAVGASFSYQWASNSEGAITLKTPIDNTVSVNEILDVTNFYGAKEKRYQELLSSPPRAPQLGNDVGIDVKSIDTSHGDVLDVEEGTPVPTPTRGSQ